MTVIIAESFILGIRSVSAYMVVILPYVMPFNAVPIPDWLCAENKTVLLGAVVGSHP